MEEQPKRIRIVGHGSTGLVLAQILAMAGMSVIAGEIPPCQDAKPCRSHSPHQGEKERERRLRRLGKP